MRPQSALCGVLCTLLASSCTEILTFTRNQPQDAGDMAPQERPSGGPDAHADVAEQDTSSDGSDTRDASTVRNGDTVAELLGGSNVVVGSSQEDDELALLARLGLSYALVSTKADQYYQGGRPTPSFLDGFMRKAHDQGRRVVLLFESYGEPNDPPSTRDAWANIGRVFAQRFGPGGTWANEQGIAGWGVDTFLAFSTPDVSLGVSPKDYAASLQGLAQGCHEVDPTLRVVPGGLVRPSGWRDYEAQGYPKAIAPLLHTRELAGLNFNTLYDIDYAPIAATYENSVQHQWEQVRLAAGISDDVPVYATQFNFKRRGVTEEQAAKGFLTGVWDHLGVVGDDGRSARTAFGMVLGLFDVDDGELQMGTRLSPWAPTLRGSTLEKVLQLSRGMRWVSRDPKVTGTYVLTDDRSTLWVWQHRTGWSTFPGPSFEVQGIPSGTTRLEVHTAVGLPRTIPISQQTSIVVDGLGEEQTYMFLSSL